MPDPRALVDYLPDGASGDDLLEAFVEWAGDRGLELYPAQEEAILGVLSGSNVIMQTPTGSGKSLVALAAHIHCIARGERSWYTAPIKALVTEKFFDLCRELGPERVGLLTGDASVNPDAPVVCATAEVLANAALSQGADTPADHVVMDEFHYYGDPDRGWAWQVPLLELRRTTFLLLSATLGDVGFFADELTARTGRPTEVVDTATRPVPIEFEYRETPIHESLTELVDLAWTPVYIVHFTQADSIEQAQRITSMGLTTRAQREAIGERLADVAFRPGFGRDLRRFLRHGVGVHHAGMLPRYRRLVETLAQEGLLPVICGTDTLGVGINLPIRSVLFERLCKYDGTTTRVLNAREFHQIAGRAGRRGYDDQGTVWVQAPAHVVENAQAVIKAGDDNKKRRKVVKKKPPERGYAPWNRDTFDRLVRSAPEKLRSSFQVSPSMVLAVLDRPGDGCGALRRLLTDNHEPRPAQRAHIRRAIALYRSLTSGGVIERLTEPDDRDRLVRVDLDLQWDFAMHQPLAPFVLHALPLIDPVGFGTAADEELRYALDVLSVVESVVEDPAVILRAQVDRARTETINRLKSEGVAYEERMAELDLVTYPKPLAEIIYPAFDVYREQHPWVDRNIRPKSVARDCFERSMGFADYIHHYGLRRSEGMVLRYLSEVWKTLMRTVPEDAKTDAVYDVTDWLGALVRGVDSSLVDEWARLGEVGDEPDLPAILGHDGTAESAPTADVTANPRAFRVLVRNEAFHWIGLAARRRWDDLADRLADQAGAADEGPGGGGAGMGPSGTNSVRPWQPSELEAAFAPYFEEHDRILDGPDARSPALYGVEEGPDTWRVRQILADPEEWHEWAIEATVDLAASREAGAPVAHIEGVRRIGAANRDAVEGPPAD